MARDTKGITLVFECQGMVEIFSSYYPELISKYHTLTLDDLVYSLIPYSSGSNSNRIQRFEELLPTENKSDAGSYLFTIEKLRESLVLTHDHIDFCFSLLAATPKNQNLKKKTHQYLDSELSHDKTWASWQLIEKLKQHEIKISNSSRWFFIKSDATSYLFSEIASSFLYAEGVEFTQLIDSWEIPSGLKACKSSWFTGTSTQCLLGLVGQIRTLIDSGIKLNDIIIPFHGEHHQLDFLKYAMVYHQIPCWDGTQAEQSPPTKIDLLESLRKDTTRELKERLTLTHILRESQRTDSWENLINKLVAMSKITSEDSEYLDSLLCLDIKDPPSSSTRNGVSIVPFHVSPPLDTPLLGFVDDSFLSPPQSPILFKEMEIEHLNQSGFPMPSYWEHRKHAQQIIEAFLIHSSTGMLFSPDSLSPNQLGNPSDVTPERLSPHTDLTPSTPVNHHVSTDSPLSRPLSATQLETYARCPAKYFFSNRLGLRRKNLFTYPLLFGQIVHTSLENYFKSHPDTSPHKLLPTQWLEKLNAEFIVAIQAIAPELDSGHATYKVLWQNFQTLAQKIPSLESQLRSSFGNYKPSRFESDFKFEVDGIVIRGKIDRMDQRDDGAVLILDYKTGKVDFSPNHIEQGTHFQALLYLLAAERTFHNSSTGILFYDLKKGEIRRGILLEECHPKEIKKAMTRGHVVSGEKYQTLKEKGLDHLKQLALSMTQGDFSPHPSSTNCMSCEYMTLCREGYQYV